MGAGVALTTIANYGFEPFRRAVRKWITHREASPGDFFGLVPFDTGALTVPATAIETQDDVLVLFQFPVNVSGLLDLEATVTDLDTGTDLLFKIGYGLVDGTYQGELIPAATVGALGQTGGTVKATLPLLGQDLSGKYCILKTTATAAGAQAGTIRIRGVIHFSGRRGDKSPALLG
jgi:hypothetical protein